MARAPAAGRPPILAALVEKIHLGDAEAQKRIGFSCLIRLHEAQRNDATIPSCPQLGLRPSTHDGRRLDVTAYSISLCLCFSVVQSSSHAARLFLPALPRQRPFDFGAGAPDFAI